MKNVPTSHDSSRVQKLNALLNEVWERNPFYTRKWCDAGVMVHEIAQFDELRQFPLVTRDEFLADQEGSPPLGANLTYPLQKYRRFFRSSGTTRAPLFWADTDETWSWIIKCSQDLFSLAGVSPEDRIFFAFPFAASSGPWIMYEAACRLDRCCFTAGFNNLDEQANWIKRFRPTVVVGKPSHVLMLGRSLKKKDSRPAVDSVIKLILGGENSFSSIRPELTDVWHAQCFDRYGLTEAGSVASECPAHFGGLHLLSNEFHAEVIDPKSGEPLSDGEWGELVLTNFGRPGRPIIRYRTGDMTRMIRNYSCACGRNGPILLGGITREMGESNTLVTRPSIS